MNESQLFDFCLDWQMGHISREDLKAEFAKHVEAGYSFNKFMQDASDHCWFVNSMYELRAE